MTGSLLRRVSHHARSLSFGLAVLSAGALLAQRGLQWYPTYAPAAALWLVLAILGPLAVDVALRQLAALEGALGRIAADPPSASTWSRDLLGRSLSDGRAAAAGLGFLAFGALSIQILVVPWTGLVRILFLVPVAAFFVFYGALGLVYVAALQWVWRARAVEAHAFVLRVPRVEVGALHRAFLALVALATGLYLAGLVVIWTSPGGPAIATVPWGRLWVFPPAAAVIAFFLLVQWRLHLLLRDARDRSLESLNQRLRLLTDAPDTALASGADEAKRLLDWRSRLWNEPVWPLDLRAVLATVLTLLIPTIDAVVGLLRAGG